MYPIAFSHHTATDSLSSSHIPGADRLVTVLVYMRFDCHRVTCLCMSSARKREKGEGRDKTSMCMCTCLCVQMDEGGGGEYKRMNKLLENAPAYISTHVSVSSSTKCLYSRPEDVRCSTQSRSGFGGAGNSFHLEPG